MSVIKLSTYLIILLTLSSCGEIHKINMFFAACTGEREISCLDWGADVYRFKSKLKKEDNYDELVSINGVDTNGNELRDDVETFIDFYFRDKLGYPENYLNYLRQYATMLDTYSRWKPNESLIKQFALDNQATLNCGMELGSYYKIYGPKRILHRNQVRFWVLNNIEQKNRLDRGFIYPSDGILKALQHGEPAILLKSFCRFKISNFSKLFESLISLNGKNNVSTVRKKIKRFERKYGTQYRDIYEHLLK